MKYLILSLIITTLAYTTKLYALKVTDKAPPVKVKSWINKPEKLIKDNDGQHIFLLEFWASWCKPCIPSINTLNFLNKKYKSKGLVIIAITEETLENITPFLKENPIHYSIGFDNNSETLKNYTNDDDGLPLAFLIDKNGTILYKGHPAQLKTIIPQVITGTYNTITIGKLDKLKKSFHKNIDDYNLRKATKNAEQILYLQPNDDEAMQFRMLAFEKMGQENAAIAFLDSLIRKFPENEKTYFIKLNLLQNISPKNTNTLANLIFSKFSNDPEVMNKLSWEILDKGRFNDRPLEIAIKAAEQALHSADKNNKPFLAACSDTLARCYYSIGILSKAIRIQEKAYQYSIGSPEELTIKKTLYFYKKTKIIMDDYQE